jgi:Cu+-exporting ATPase
MDTPKPEAAQALAALRQRGLRLRMLSGDNWGAARAMAAQVGLQAHEVMAEVRPGDKARAIEQLQHGPNLPQPGAQADAPTTPEHAHQHTRQRHTVLMVGDGINDAPALVRADVGMAMVNPQGGGADVAMQAAGITLMRADLRLVGAALDISQRTLRKIRQNLFWAFVYNVCGMGLAAWGWLNPMWAGAAMAMSSLSVMANALLLQRWRP